MPGFAYADFQGNALDAINGHVKPQFIFIELLCYWQGRIKVSEIQEQFNLSRQQASSYINQYQALDETNPFVGKDKNYGRYVAENFKPKFIQTHVDHYLNWLNSGILPCFDSPQVSPYLTVLPIPSRNISPLIMRPLIQAIQDNKWLEIEYASLNRPDNDGRIIVPHSLVKTNLRWHVRAWDQEKQRFADFNLSRFREPCELLTEVQQVVEQDNDWNTEITLIFTPDSRLPASKQKVLEQDYQMTNGELHVQTRACLASYVLQDMGVNVKFLDAQPEAQQLVLANAREVKPWLING